MSHRTAEGTRRRRAAVGLLAGLLLSSAGAASDLDASRLGWSWLSFRARKFVFSLESDLSIELVPAADPDSEPVVRLTLDARGMGRAARTRLWIEPQGARAIERTQLRSGGRKRHKRMRFTDRGIEVVVRRPAAGDNLMRPESWSDRRERFEPFPDWLDDGVEVSEPTALFYALAASSLDAAGDRIELPILSDDELILVEALVSGREEIEVDYLRTSSVGEEAVRGRVSALRVELGGRRLDPRSTTADLEFMGMRGKIEIFLDPETRAPLQVSGRVPVAGRAHARIRRLTLKDEPPIERSPQ